MNSYEQKQIEYLAAMCAAMDGMILRMALSLEHHNIVGVDRLLLEYNRIKGNINKDFPGVWLNAKAEVGRE